MNLLHGPRPPDANGEPVPRRGPGAQWGELAIDPNSPYERLKEAIIEGEFKAGQHLIEVEVGGWLGVGRTPTRDALARLEQDGLLERTDRGLVVRLRSPEEILDIYEIRVVLEGLVARYAAQRHNRIDRLRIERSLAAADVVPVARYGAYTREFHRVIWIASHNESIIALADRLSSHLTRLPASALETPGRWEESLSEHRRIADAVLSRDEEAASAAATAHFQRATHVRLELLEAELF